MQKTNAPFKYTVPFAMSGARNTVPTTPPSSPSSPALAAYSTGFPAATMEPIASGGVPPFGQDFNGLYYDATNALLWKQAGFVYGFDSGFAGNSNIGGYPAQSLLSRADGKGLWINTVDNNATNPDASGAVGWLAVRGNAGFAGVAMSSATVTPDPSLLGAPVLNCTGALTANTALILPLTAGASWLIQNSTTGSFNLTVQGSSGAGVQISQGSAAQIYTDGTNFYTTTANVSGLYLPINGNAVSASKWANARTITYTGGATGSVTLDGSANVSCALTLAGNAPTSSKWASPISLALTGPVTGSANIDGSGNVGLATAFAANPSFSGTVTASSNFVLGSASSGLTTGVTQGLQIFWNTLTPGSGRLEYINNHGGGGGGHYWYDRQLTTSSAVNTMNLTQGGNLTVLPASSTQTGGVGTFAYIAQGTWGGGLGLIDGTNNIGLFSVGGSLTIGTGTNLGALTTRATIDASGNITAAGAVYAGTNFVSSAVNAVLAATGTTGAIFFRPQGTGSGTGQVYIDASGNVNCSATVYAGNYFTSTTTSAFLSASGAGGQVVLRPGGPGSPTGQLIVSSSGNVNCGSLSTGAISGSSASISGVISALSSAVNSVQTPATQGNWLQWNQTGGQGEADFVNNHGGGVGGWNWYDTSGGGTSLSLSMSLSAAGNLVATGTVRGGSDARIKANVTPIRGALSRVRAGLVGTEYERLDQGHRREAGFIAQRVKEHLPLLVDVAPRNGIEDFHTLDYMHATAYIAAALVELHDLVLERRA